MARDPVSAFFSLTIGLVLGTAGVVLAGWVVLTIVKIERGFDAMMWAAAHSPVALARSPVDLANSAINSKLWFGIAAAILCAFGWSMLRGARRSLRAPGESYDGGGEITLRGTAHRVGGAVEGNVTLGRAAAGEDFIVRLLCGRSYWSGNSRRVERAFESEQKVRVVQGARGPSVPFRFDVPASAPPSSKGLGSALGYHWQLEVFLAKGWFPRRSTFDLELAAASQTEIRALQAAEPAAMKADLDQIGRRFEMMGQGALLPHHREALRKAPDQLALAKKLTDPATLLKSILVLFFAIFVFLPALVLVVAFGLGAFGVGPFSGR